MEWKSMGFGWQHMYGMENNPAMFETTNQYISLTIINHY